MKLITTPLLSLAFLASSIVYGQSDLKDGDIIFIRNKETRGKSLLPNGKSKFNYLGVIFLESGKPYVYHAAEPFSKTPLDDFMKLAEGDITVKHLSEEELLTQDVIGSMKSYAMAKVGTAYDNQINLNNNMLYNAEFAWKLYQTTLGLPLCIPREIKEYKVDNPATIEFLTDAYGPSVMNEKIVTVGDIYQSQFLE